MKSTNSLVAVGCALALSACGGGGGDAGAPVSAPTSTLSSISSADANKAAGNGYAASTVLGQSSTSLSGMVAGVSVAPAQVGVVTPVLTLAKRALGADGSRLLAGVTVSEACSGGGTVTIDATMKSENAFSNGDKLAISAKDCIEDGDRLNGTVAITISGVSGDLFNTNAGAATLDTRFTAFSVASGSTTDVVNGDMKIHVEAKNANDLSLTIFGTSLQATEQKSGATVATRTLTDYGVTSRILGSTVTTAANFRVAGSANGLGQFTYTVQSVQPFTSTIGSDLPTSGALVVHGTASSVYATVVSNGVRVDYSAKGDGAVTQTNTLTWADFLAGA